MIKSRILLVDDHPLNRFMVETILQKWNYEIGIAENGVEALEKIALNDFDLILMDIRMPILDGNETVKILRNDFLLQTPIVAITSDSIYEEEKSAQGFDGFITKPFEHKQMQVLLNDLIQQKKPEINRLDFSHLHIQTQGDDVFANRMKELFFAEIDSVISTIHQSYLNNQIKEIKQAIHQLKPSLRCFLNEQIVQNFVGFEVFESDEVTYLPYSFIFHLRKLKTEYLSDFLKK